MNDPDLRQFIHKRWDFAIEKRSFGGLSVNSLHDLIEWGALQSVHGFTGEWLEVVARTVEDERGLKLDFLIDLWGLDTLSGRSTEVQLE